MRHKRQAWVISRHFWHVLARAGSKRFENQIDCDHDDLGYSSSEDGGEASKLARPRDDDLFGSDSSCPSTPSEAPYMSESELSGDDRSWHPAAREVC